MIVTCFHSETKVGDVTRYFKAQWNRILELQREAFWVLRPVCSSWKLQQNMNHLHIKHWSTQGIFPAQHGYQPVTDLDVAMFCTLHVRQRWQKTAVDALQQSWLVVSESVWLVFCAHHTWMFSRDVAAFLLVICEEDHAILGCIPGRNLVRMSYNILWLVVYLPHLSGKLT